MSPRSHRYPESRQRGTFLYCALDIVLLTADTGYQPKTTEASLMSLLSATTTEKTGVARGINTPMEWTELSPCAEVTRRLRHTDVSQDPRYTIPGSSASDGDMECTEARTRLPPWVLPTEETQINALRGRPRHCTRPHQRQGRASHPQPGPDHRQQEIMHPHYRRSRIVQRPRLRHQTHKEGREIPPPPSRPSRNNGKSGVCRHPHRTCGYHATPEH